MKKILIPIGALISGMWPMYELTRLILFTDHHGVRAFGWTFGVVVEIVCMWILYLGAPLAIYLALTTPSEKEEE